MATPKTFRARRRLLELSQATVAKKVGISQQLLSFFEHEKRTLSPEKLRRLGNALSVPVEESE